MSYIYYSQTLNLVISLLSSLTIALSTYFLHQKKEFFIFFIPVMGLLLTLFYGYKFYTSTSFFPGLMVGISGFFIVPFIIEIFNRYSKE